MRNREAFSIVEVLVALVVFSVAALGSAAALGWSARLQRDAVARRDAVRALEARLVALTTAPCDSVAGGPVVVNGVVVQSAVTRTDSLITVVVAASHKGTTTTLRTEVKCP
jgi:prepilin-type N-terminal cleavage/methylation domain-containing protein